LYNYKKNYIYLQQKLLLLLLLLFQKCCKNDSSPCPSCILTQVTIITPTLTLQSYAHIIILIKIISIIVIIIS